MRRHAPLICPRCKQKTTERTCTGNLFCRPCDCIVGTDAKVTFTQDELAAFGRQVEAETRAQLARNRKQTHD
jgi:ribosomal protein L37AE/L43A